MKQLLAERNIRLTKSLGQNFLHDANQLRRIVALAELEKSDRVLEIGPGLGPLTELLAQEAGEVLAIEKDAKLFAALEERFKVQQADCAQQPTGGRSVPRLVRADALDYLGRESRDWGEWKVVSNLPYSVASPILVELAQARRGPRRIVVTLQIEVAKRLLATACTADYGLLTLLVQLDYEPNSWFKIPASCFFPEPEVDSACLCLVRRDQPLLAPEQRASFVKVVRRSFSQRRKMMFKLLKLDWPEPVLAAAFEQLDLSPQIRAEAVSVEQFTRLAQGLCGHSR